MKPLMLLLSLALAVPCANAQLRAEVTPDYLKERLAEVTPFDKGLPDDILSLNDERVAITAELSRLSDYLKNPDFSKETRTLIAAKDITRQQLAELGKTDCKALKTGTFTTPTRGLNSVVRVVFQHDLEEVENPWAQAPNQREMLTLPPQTNANGGKHSLLVRRCRCSSSGTLTQSPPDLKRMRIWRPR